jgi:hypothetical protein
LAILYRTPLDLTMLRFKKRLRTVGFGCATSVQKKSSTGNRRKTSREKESRQFIARATQQVFPLCQPAIPLSQQLELRLQRDLSQSLQAQWWEPELLQE